MLNIDKFSSVPVYEQIIEQMKRLIMVGSIRPEEQIPSVRALSMELSINPNTIQKAYNELEIRGITSSVPGVGRFVAKNARELLQKEFAETLRELEKTVLNLAIAEVDEQEVIAIVRSAYKKAGTYTEMRDKHD